MGSRNEKRHKPQPVVRFRYIGYAVVFVAIASTGPLFTVWKQVYMRSVAIRKEALADSLSVYNRQILNLRLTAAALSSTSRIEKIARTGLGLEYPPSERIVVIRQTERTESGLHLFDRWQLFAIIRRSLRQGSGT